MTHNDALTLEITLEINREITPETFKAQIAALTAQIAGQPLDAALDAWLNAHHGPDSATFSGLKASAQAGVAAGWLCDREGGGIRFGRIFKAGQDLAAKLFRDSVGFEQNQGGFQRH